MTVTDVHFLANETVLELNTGTTEAPTWTRVRFASAIDPKIDPTMKDATTYDDAGYYRDVKTALRWSCEFTIDLYKMSDGAYLPEAEALRQAALSLSDDGLVEVRWYNTAEAHQGQAHVKWERANNAPDDVERVKVSLSGAGALDNDITNPSEEVLDYTLTITATGGTFTLTVTRAGASQTTAAIAYNAAAGVVEDALEALSNVVPGEVEVTGGASPKTLTWAVAVTMTIGVGSLTGGSATLVEA